MEVILNIEDYKQRLRAKEQELLGDARRAEASVRDLSDPSAQDWSDASVNDEEKSGQINELDIDSTTLNRVRDALKRIEEGTYGKYVVDGGPIEEKRLQAMPWTPYCLKHEQLLEKEHPRRMPTL
jgi:DnaK suppressor protein